MTVHKKIGRYIVEGRLGEGAMGSVFLAHDPVIKRKVAIKTVKLDSSRQEDESKEFYERFIREAQISGQINHPNIVQIFDVGFEEAMPYIAMEYVDGQTLNGFCKDIPKPSLSERLNILDQISSALDYAHEKSIVHRDLKPSNIMVMKDNTAKIMDFGIAKMSDSNLTQTGVFLGTPSYSSPEQVKEGIVDFRSDLFCFGILSHEVLTGYLPFPGQTINAILYKIANEPPTFAPNMKDIPADIIGWRQIFGKILNKKPEHRYQSASEFITAIKDIITLADEDKTLLGRSQPDLDATVRDPNLAMNLARSDYEMQGGKARQASQTSDPTAKRSATLPVLLFLLLVTSAVAISWKMGYLDEQIDAAFTYIESREEPQLVEDTPPPVVSLQKNLAITSNPAGATISINGQVSGPTPQAYIWSATPGQQLNVKAELDGFTTVEETLVFSEDLSEQVVLTMKALPILREISSTPGQADITLDGTKLGKSPVSFDFVSGQSYTIIAEKEGYFQKKVTYEEGKTETSALALRLKAIPPPGNLEVKTNMEDLKITIGGATQRGTRATVKAGSYQVRLRSTKYFYNELRKDVTITSGETTHLETPILINIPKIEFVGDYVKVKIDGQFVKNKNDEIDTTPLIDLLIAAGSHQFEFIDQNDKVVLQKTFEVVKSESIVETFDNTDNQ